MERHIVKWSYWWVGQCCDALLMRAFNALGILASDSNAQGRTVWYMTSTKEHFLFFCHGPLPRRTTPGRVANLSS